MKARQVAFNALTHALLVEYHVVKGDARAAAQAYGDATAAGIQIRPASFEKLLARCERSGESDLMVRLTRHART
jgi:hypothetical protein